MVYHGLGFLTTLTKYRYVLSDCYLLYVGARLTREDSTADEDEDESGESSLPTTNNAEDCPELYSAPSCGESLSQLTGF